MVQANIHTHVRRDEQVLEAIFNPENPVMDLEASGRTDNQFYTFEESVAQILNIELFYVLSLL